MIDRQIIAFGHGGLDAKDPLTDLYIIAQTKKVNPRVCLIPTAAGDNQSLIGFFYKLYEQYPCDPFHLSLFNPKTADIEDYLLSMDAVFVAGGHTKSMLGVWYEWSLDKMLRKAYDNGVLLTGGSAGAVCWFDQCITDSIHGKLSLMDCLGFLPYSCCPHFLSQERQKACSDFIISKELKPGYAIDDYAGVHFLNEQPLRSISTSKQSKTYKISCDDNVMIKEQLKHTDFSRHSIQELIWDAPAFASLEKHSNDNTNN